MGMYEEAIAAYRALLVFEPDNFSARAGLGGSLIMYGEEAEGYDEFRRTKAIDPENALVCCDIGDALLSTGSIDEAIAEYKKR